MDDRQVHELDVFLSFVEVDDAPVGDGKTPEVRREPCVSFFRDRLKRAAARRLGRELRIADSRESVPSSSAAAFIAVISPDFVNDPDAMDQVDDFLAARADRPDRIFTLLRSPVSPDQLLEELSQARSYALGDAEGPTLIAHVMRAASSLAEDLVDALTEPGAETGESADAGTVARTTSPPSTVAPPAAATGATRAVPAGDGPTTPPPDAPSTLTVFLAHTDPDLGEFRERLRSGLERRGFRVVPEGPAPTDFADIEALTRDGLREADLSVHLLGDRYDDAAELECVIAGEDCGSADRPRHVWLASATPPSDPRLKRLYREVEEAEQATSPYRRVSFERFEPAVLRALEERNAPPAPPPAPGYRYVYLVYDRRDVKWVDRLANYLTNPSHRLRLLRPLVGDEDSRPTAEDIDRQHRENLEVCDACLVVYGEAPETWFGALSTDWVRLERVWRPGDDVKRGYCLFDPMTEQKVSFREPGNVVIRAGDRVRPEDLQPFITAATEVAS